MVNNDYGTEGFPNPGKNKGDDIEKAIISSEVRRIIPLAQGRILQLSNSNIPEAKRLLTLLAEIAGEK